MNVLLKVIAIGVIIYTFIECVGVTAASIVALIKIPSRFGPWYWWLWVVCQPFLSFTLGYIIIDSVYQNYFGG